MMLGLATAGPVLSSKPTPPRTGCRIGISQSLSLQELEVSKKGKDALVQERPKALQAELALTLEVLENVTDSALGPILHQPLHTLCHIQSQLQACTQSQPTAEPGSPSGRLFLWLHRLQEAQEKETPGFLVDSVTSNFFRLLMGDLKCVARGDQCEYSGPTQRIQDSGLHTRSHPSLNLFPLTFYL
uniref:interferon lambda-2-like n=1 Tax=Myodes glareolus TaxID=447135 RepID=UPI0020223088|nr:interferon lambda-2-like [Myodes glareolus]